MKPLQSVLSQIKKKNPKHFEKLELNLNGYGDTFEIDANRFLQRYQKHLEKQNKDLSFGVDCYLHLIDDMIEVRIDFIRTGRYANTSFVDVEKSIYSNPEVMTYHMHGLVLAQFLWFDQYERVLFFMNNLEKHFTSKGQYLEIGGGHGLYLLEAIRLLSDAQSFTLVDISESSLNLAKGIANNENVNYLLKNIFDFEDHEKYNFITIGEVIEHVEDPLALLTKTANLLTDNGVCYLTTPINAPMIDHIYLFNNAEEIRTMFDKAGLQILEERIVISEKMEPLKAAKRKVPVMYAAFVKRK